MSLQFSQKCPSTLTADREMLFRYIFHASNAKNRGKNLQYHIFNTNGCDNMRSSIFANIQYK